MSDPAHRHGGPDAGWYVPSGHGWQRISDGEVGGHGDAAHFMSDPNEPPSPLTLTMHRDLSAGEMDELRQRFAAALAEPGQPRVRWEHLDHGQKPPAS